jgi:hypothetical protein
MSFTVEWDYPAEAVLLRHIPWPTSGEVAIAVHRYAREVAPKHPTGERRIVAAGYALGVRIDTERRTVLVLYAYRLR